jgi:hypothetical protein
VRAAPRRPRARVPCGGRCGRRAGAPLAPVRLLRRRDRRLDAEAFSAPFHTDQSQGAVEGYDATLVSDAHTTEDHTAWGAPPPGQVIARTNPYWAYQTAPGRTVATKDVDFGGTC